MSTIERLHGLAGAWEGTNKVWLPPAEQPYASGATAEVEPVAGGKFVQIAYTWAFEGEAQDGVMLWGYEASGEAVTFAWIDSWHMGDKLMLSMGSADGSGDLVVTGSFAVEDGPDWGWRTELRIEGDAFRWLMYNIEPDGQEMLGVETAFQRV